jgi:hypothetical protein
LSVVAGNSNVKSSSAFLNFIDPKIFPALQTLSNPIHEGYLSTQPVTMTAAVGGVKLGSLLPQKMKVWNKRWCVISKDSFALHVFKSKASLAVPSDRYIYFFVVASFLFFNN